MKGTFNNYKPDSKLFEVKRTSYTDEDNLKSMEAPLSELRRRCDLFLRIDKLGRKNRNFWYNPVTNTIEPWTSIEDYCNAITLVSAILYYRRKDKIY